MGWHILQRIGTDHNVLLADNGVVRLLLRQVIWFLKKDYIPTSKCLVGQAAKHMYNMVNKQIDVQGLTIN